MKRSENHNGRDLILRHLEIHGVINKDSEASPTSIRPIKAAGKTAKRNRQTLDLHGMTVKQAIAVLKTALDDAIAEKGGELVVIHGVGHHSDPARGPVIKQAVRKVLENFPKTTLTWHPAKPKDGGLGATIIRFQ